MIEFRSKFPVDYVQISKTVYKTGTTSTTATTTIINKSKLSDSEVSSIKSVLGTGVVSSSSSESKVDCTIIIGKDYK